jgi:aminopeptidase
VTIPDADLTAYADLVVKVGANVQEGQAVVVSGLVEHAPLMRALVDSAYRAGARRVDPRYEDRIADRSRLALAPDADVDAFAGWYEQLFAETVEERCAFIHVVGEPDPEPYAGLDPARVGRLGTARSRLSLPLVTSAEVNWVICSCPLPQWAEHVYGEPDTTRLWRDLRTILRLDEPDPVAAWEAHMSELDRRSASINDAGLEALHFRGPGTDLLVPLHADARWSGARFRTRWGRSFIPNLPTEEVYTTPDFRGVEGTVRCTRPALISGQVVEGLELRFAGGTIEHVSAARGAQIVEEQLRADEGARRLGEIALVDRASRIGQTGRVFHEVLLDENATCHMAWGGAILEAFDDLPESPEEQAARGINRSGIHTDVMIGGPEVAVTGVGRDGAEVPVIVDDSWQL